MVLKGGKKKIQSFESYPVYFQATNESAELPAPPSNTPKQSDPQHIVITISELQLLHKQKKAINYTIVFQKDLLHSSFPTLK